MNEQDRTNEPVDGLVRRFLESEEAQVDTDALMTGLLRRRARRRVVRLSVRLCAAAAALLIVVGVLSHHGKPPQQPPAAPQSVAALPAALLAAVRLEVEAALRGAASSGAAVVSAGRVPLTEVAQANRLLPNLVGQAGSAVDRFLESTNPRSDQTQEEDPQWRL